MKNKNKQYEEVEERIWDGMSKDNEEEMRPKETFSEVFRCGEMEGKFVPYYKTLWDVPHSVLSLYEQKFILKINNLSKSEKGCFAENKWIANDLQISTRTLDKILKKMRDMNILKTKYILGRRYLSINDNFNFSKLHKKNKKKQNKFRRKT